MAYTFYIKADDSAINKALRQISVFDGKTRLKVERAVKNGTQAVGRAARKNVPVKTGALRKSIKTSFKSRAIVGEAKAMSPVAHLIEYGAKSAIIMPKNKKALTIDDYGVRRYAAKARIPARRAHPFLKPAYDAKRDKIIKDVEEAVKK